MTKENNSMNVEQRLDELGRGLPDEINKIMDAAGTSGNGWKKALEDVMAIENEQVHQDLAEMMELLFTQGLNEFANDPELVETVQMMGLIDGLSGVFGGAAEDKEIAEIFDMMHMLVYMAKYAHDIKGETAAPVVQSYIQKLSVLSDEDYNNPLKMMALFIEVGVEQKTGDLPANPFRPQP